MMKKLIVICLALCLFLYRLVDRRMLRKLEA